MRSFGYSVTLILFACSAEPLPAGRYRITTGQETDIYTQSPAPVTFTVSKQSSLDDNASWITVSNSNAPVQTIEVETAGSNWYTLQGTDAAGTRRIQANSFAISGVGMAGYEYPLFVGRTDIFSRPPGFLLTAQGDHPPVGIVWGRYLWALGGAGVSAVQTDSYDLIEWAEAAAGSTGSLSSLTCPQQPCRVESLALYSAYNSTTSNYDQYALAIGGTWALGIDVYSATSVAANPPTGLSSWADIAGGHTVTNSSGASFIVAATRSGTGSTAVLEVATDSKLYARNLGAQRQRAAAAYVSNYGLVVVGGSGTAAGAELLAPSTTSFVSLPYPPDETQGAALLRTSLSSGVLWRIGGRKLDGTPAPSVAYDLACVQNCQPTPLVGFDVDVSQAQGFGYGDYRIVVGEKGDGTMVAWRITNAGLVEIPQRLPRRSATAFQLPNGFVALVGGTLVSDGSPAMALELVAN